MSPNHFPKIHNATWPGLVGKGEGSEPPISQDQMIEMTAAAEVDGVRFDGVDIFLCAPHTDIDSSDDDIKRLAEQVAGFGLNIGSLVAPVWPPAGGGSAMGSDADRKQFVTQIRKSCRIGSLLRKYGVRHYGVIRMDSSCDPGSWAQDPAGNTKKIAATFAEACDVAADFDEKLALEGEICWGGMHSWKHMVNTLEAVNRPNIGFQADMAHSFLYLLGYNSPEDRILPENFDWNDRETLDAAMKKLTAALRPWTIDFHVAQNDGTVHGSGSHDKTGRHCLATDPSGKMDIVHDAGFWLRDEDDNLTKKFMHICWDGCMFPNSVMMQQQTWNDILAVMIKVREAHGWN